MSPPIGYHDLAPLTIQKSGRDFYAYDDRNYDGAGEFPHNVYGHGYSPNEAVANWFEKREDN